MKTNTIYIPIDIRERLPEKDGRYIVNNHGQWHEANYCKEYSFHEEMTDCSAVTHWMEEVVLLEPNDMELMRTASTQWPISYEAFMSGASFILNHIKGGGGNVE